MKRILIFILVFMLCIPLNVKAYEPTGHKGILDVAFENGGKLLARMKPSDYQIVNSLVNKKKFFGWRTAYIHINEKAQYIGETVFSKANQTDKPFTMNYVLKEDYKTKTTYTISGKISGQVKASMKIKLVNLEGTQSGEISGSYTGSTENSKSEETKMTITIPPYKKLTYRVTGECYVTSGVCQYYAVWIKIYRGQFEVIDVTTRYYELLEEDL
ncbi:MAG TPA: hypothetical protein PKH00_01525 [Bacilli bacterium]|jgi:hypothetical protein|nr:hypothetical protein [Bacilli bacterium]HNZ74075.1 hypothetical protein [Bacilli bacterium]HPA98878.1 hypothetical protein [Bacilli bacterium]HQO93783.1 hypothetical protein [Bacilli bacterium]HQQ39270.1 hypothetical protein [Bacilli bacterium]